MSTRNRRDFVLQSIRYFQRRDYPARELIILDDDTDDLSDQIPDDSRIRYLRMTPGLSIGAKRNRGCQLARGSIIAQWDDDDRYAPGRLSAQVAPILAGEAHISGLKAEACFKRFWEEHRFPDLNEGWDTMFVWGLTDANVVPLANHTFYIGTVHRHHSSPKKTDSLGWHTFPVQEIRRLLRATWSFYEG